MPKNSWSDERVDQFIGGILQSGVIVAGLIVLVGGVLYLIQNAQAPVHYRVFQGESLELRSLGPVIRGAFHLDSRAVIQLGILLLIATPVARVAFSVVAFALQRDRIYVPVTMIVLAILLFSLFGGPR